MIVFKCENPDCKYPDHKECLPCDDNVICKCGATAWGHFGNVEDLEKAAAFESLLVEPEWELEYENTED